MPRSLSPEDYDLNSEREHRLDRDASRESYEDEARRRVQVALKRYADSPADVLERIALVCSSAFCAPLDDDSPTPSADAVEA